MTSVTWIWKDKGGASSFFMEVTRLLLLRLFYLVKWPITPNKSAGSVLTKAKARSSKTVQLKVFTT